MVDLEEATFLVGRNGAGKSNLVKAIWMLSRLTREPLSSLLDEYGGMDAVRNRTGGGVIPMRTHDFHIAITFGTKKDLSDAIYNFYGFGLRTNPEGGFKVSVENARCDESIFDRTEDDFESSVSNLVPSLESDSLALPLIAGSTAFAPLSEILSLIRFAAIVPDRVREYQIPDSGQALRPDGSNVASVLREMVERHPERHTRLCEFLQAAVPGIVDVRHKKVGNRLTLEFIQEATTDIRFEAFSMSDGTLRIVGLLIALLQSPSPIMLVIEEPEAAIHPGALAVLLDAMKEAKERMQLLVTTQSPELLDADWITEDDVRIVEWQNGFSRIVPLASGTRDVLRRHLFTVGELLRDNALIGEPVAP